MELRGKFLKVVSREQIKRKDGTDVVDRGGRVMEKLIFVIQLPSANKEKYAAFETINNILMNYIVDLRSGSEVVVQCEPESREWNGKWFTSIVATNIETETQVRDNKASDLEYAHQPEDDSDLPF